MPATNTNAATQKLALDILGYGSPAHVTEFLKHITRMVHLEIKKDETFTEHFKRLEEEYFKNEPAAQEAVVSFVSLQTADLDVNIYGAYGMDKDSNEKNYHSFNLYKA